MIKVKKSYLLLAIVLPMLLIGICTPERSFAEVSEVRIAKQYGLTYLPLIILEEQKLIEKHALKSGL
ncbi:MAG: ABC transporter substrate-binding protein, partial [Chlorobium sp.]